MFENQNLSTVETTPHGKNRLNRIIVSNSYAGHHIGVLPLGGNIALAGGNGNGKTTLLNLIALFMGASPYPDIWNTAEKWKYFLGGPNKLIAYEYLKQDGPRLAILFSESNNGVGGLNTRWVILNSGYQRDLFVRKESDGTEKFNTIDEVIQLARLRDIPHTSKLTAGEYEKVISGHRALLRLGSERKLKEYAKKYSLNNFGEDQGLYGVARLQLNATNSKLDFNTLLKLVVQQAADNIAGDSDKKGSVETETSKDLVITPNLPHYSDLSVATKRFEAWNIMQKEVGGLDALTNKAVEITSSKESFKEHIASSIALEASIGNRLSLTETKLQKLQEEYDSAQRAKSALLQQYTESINALESKKDDIQNRISKLNIEKNNYENGRRGEAEHPPISEMVTFVKKSSGISNQLSEQLSLITKLEIAAQNKDTEIQELIKPLDAQIASLKEGYSTLQIQCSADEIELRKQFDEDLQQARSLADTRVDAARSAYTDNRNALKSSIDEIEQSLSAMDEKMHSLFKKEYKDEEISRLHNLLNQQTDGKKSIQDKIKDLTTKGDKIGSEVQALQTAVHKSREALEGLKKDKAAWEDKLTEINEKLAPDNLLSFLRSPESCSLYKENSDLLLKVINPDLLSRRDLKPFWDEEDGSNTLSRLVIDSSVIGDVDNALHENLLEEQRAINAKLQDVRQEISQTESSIRKDTQALQNKEQDYLANQSSIQTIQSDLNIAEQEISKTLEKINSYFNTLATELENQRKELNGKKSTLSKQQDNCHNEFLEAERVIFGERDTTLATLASGLEKSLKSIKDALVQYASNMNVRIAEINAEKESIESGASSERTQLKKAYEQLAVLQQTHAQVKKYEDLIYEYNQFMSDKYTPKYSQYSKDIDDINRKISGIKRDKDSAIEEHQRSINSLNVQIRTLETEKNQHNRTFSTLSNKLEGAINFAIENEFVAGSLKGERPSPSSDDEYRLYDTDALINQLSSWLSGLRKIQTSYNDSVSAVQKELKKMELAVFAAADAQELNIRRSEEGLFEGDDVYSSLHKTLSDPAISLNNKVVAVRNYYHSDHEALKSSLFVQITSCIENARKFLENLDILKNNVKKVIKNLNSRLAESSEDIKTSKINAIEVDVDTDGIRRKNWYDILSNLCKLTENGIKESSMQEVVNNLNVLSVLMKSSGASSAVEFRASRDMSFKISFFEDNRGEVRSSSGNSNPSSTGNTFLAKAVIYATFIDMISNSCSAELKLCLDEASVLDSQNMEAVVKVLKNKNLTLVTSAPPSSFNDYVAPYFDTFIVCDNQDKTFSWLVVGADDYLDEYSHDSNLI